MRHMQVFGHKKHYTREKYVKPEVHLGGGAADGQGDGLRNTPVVDIAEQGGGDAVHGAADGCEGVHRGLSAKHVVVGVDAAMPSMAMLPVHGRNEQ